MGRLIRALDRQTIGILGMCVVDLSQFHLYTLALQGWDKTDSDIVPDSQ